MVCNILERYEIKMTLSWVDITVASKCKFLCYIYIYNGCIKAS